MTPLQEHAMKTLAWRWGCWPDDTTWSMQGDDLVVMMGLVKGRPKVAVITTTGRVRTRGEGDGPQAA